MNPVRMAPEVGGPAANTLPAIPAWGKRKGWNDSLAQALTRDAHAFDYGRKLRRCAQHVTVTMDLSRPGVADQRVTSAHLCQLRLCPICGWRKATAWRARLIPGLQEFHEVHPSRVALFLTLTVRNVRPDQLREAVQEMHKGWGRLVQRAEFPTGHWLRRTEVTIGRLSTGPDVPPGPFSSASRLRGPLSGEGGRDGSAEPPAGGAGALVPVGVHPHIHALLLVRPSYFKRTYVRQGRWQQLWAEVMGLDYAPIVDVRRARAKDHDGTGARPAIAAAIEAAKYIAKADELTRHPQLFATLTDELRGLRMIATSRELSRWVRNDDPSGDELLETAPAIAGDGFGATCAAAWDSGSRAYFFAP